MTESTETEERRVAQWFRNGPSADDGTIGWFLGMWFWWRLYAIALTVVAGYLAGAYVATEFGSGMWYPIGFTAGIVVGSITEWWSP